MADETGPMRVKNGALLIFKAPKGTPLDFLRQMAEHLDERLPGETKSVFVSEDLELYAVVEQ